MTTCNPGAGKASTAAPLLSLLVTHTPSTPAALRRASFETLTLAFVTRCSSAPISACSSDVAPSPELRAERSAASPSKDATPSEASTVAIPAEPTQPELTNPELLPYLRHQIELVPAAYRAVLEDTMRRLERRMR